MVLQNTNCNIYFSFCPTVKKNQKGCWSLTKRNCIKRSKDKHSCVKSKEIVPFTCFITQMTASFSLITDIMHTYVLWCFSSQCRNTQDKNLLFFSGLEYLIVKKHIGPKCSIGEIEIFKTYLIVLWHCGGNLSKQNFCFQNKLR